MKIPNPRKLPSGSWFIQLRLDGQSIPITEDSEEKCIARAMAIKTGIIQVKRKPENMTLRDACTKYIESRRNRLSLTTIQSYEKIRDNNFQTIMDLKLCDITRKKLEKAVEAECGMKSPRTGTPYAPKTIHNAYKFLGSVLSQYAPDLDTSVRLPEMKRKPVAILTPEQIYAAVKGTSVELPCLLSMWLSFSMSEIRGLTKSKSICNGQISVAETVVDIGGKPVKKTGGKEENRSRTLTIPPYLMQLIDQVDGDIIVPQSAQTIAKRFYVILKKNGLPHINFHKLRHINASVMSMLGLPEKEALERGGWKTDSIYKQVYTHTFSEQRKQSDEKVNSYFDNIIANANANK